MTDEKFLRETKEDTMLWVARMRIFTSRYSPRILYIPALPPSHGGRPYGAANTYEGALLMVQSSMKHLLKKGNRLDFTKKDDRYSITPVALSEQEEND